MSTQNVLPPTDAAPAFQAWNEGVPEGATYFHDPMHFPFPWLPSR